MVQIFECPAAGRHPMCEGCCRELRGRIWKETGQTHVSTYNGAGPLGKYEYMRGSCLSLMGAGEPGLINRILPVLREEG